MNINDEDEDVFYNNLNDINNEELDNEIAEINILYDEMMKNENISEIEKDKESIDLNTEGNKDSFDKIDLNNEIIEVIEPQNIITHNDIIVPEPIYETNILRNRNVNYNKIFDDSIPDYIINNVFKDANNKKIIKKYKKVKSTYLTNMGFFGILLSVNLMVYIIYTNKISNIKMITY